VIRWFVYIASGDTMIRLYSVKWYDDSWKMNWKGRARRRLRYFRSICFYTSRKTASFRANNWNRDILKTIHVYVLITRLRRSVEPQRTCLQHASRCYIAWPILRPWRWKRHFSLKRRMTFNGLHDMASQDIEPFITTTVRTWNPKHFGLISLFTSWVELTLM
jgi:hypothetical protein